MKEMVKNEVLKLLDAGIIYPIADSKWISPTQVVPKKSGVTVVENEKWALEMCPLIRLLRMYDLFLGMLVSIGDSFSTFQGFLISYAIS